MKQWKRGFLYYGLAEEKYNSIKQWSAKLTYKFSTTHQDLQETPKLNFPTRQCLSNNSWNGEKQDLFLNHKNTTQSNFWIKYIDELCLNRLYIEHLRSKISAKSIHSFQYSKLITSIVFHLPWSQLVPSQPGAQVQV